MEKLETYYQYRTEFWDYANKRWCHERTFFTLDEAIKKPAVGTKTRIIEMEINESVVSI